MPFAACSDIHSRLLNNRLQEAIMKSSKQPYLSRAYAAHMFTNSLHCLQRCKAALAVWKAVRADVQVAYIDSFHHLNCRSERPWRSNQGGSAVRANLQDQGGNLKDSQRHKHNSSGAAGNCNCSANAPVLGLHLQGMSQER